MIQLTEEVERLKAIREEERVKWEMRIAQSEAENATLKVNKRCCECSSKNSTGQISLQCIILLCIYSI